MSTVQQDSVYGSLLAASDVEDGLLTILETWLNSYLAEVERQHAIEVGLLPRPRSYVVSSEISKMPEDQIPAVIIASPGLTDPPQADGFGMYTARWKVQVAAEVVAKGNRLALKLARLYALALRAVVIQQQYDDIPVRRIDWIDERYDVLDSADDRTVCIGVVEFAVEVPNVLTRDTGPLTPEAAPGPPSPTWPTAQTEHMDVVKVPIEE
jgi:hypothetical protein